MLWSVYLLNMKQGVLLSCWSVWYLRKSSQASLTAVRDSMTQMGMRATSGWNAFTTGTKFKMARPTKYTLAMRWNCSNKFMGMKDHSLYLLVLMALPSYRRFGCSRFFRSSKGKLETTVLTGLSASRCLVQPCRRRVRGFVQVMTSQLKAWALIEILRVL